MAAVLPVEGPALNAINNIRAAMTKEQRQTAIDKAIIIQGITVGILKISTATGGPGLFDNQINDYWNRRKNRWKNRWKNSK